MKDLWDSITRTLVPYVVSLIMAWLATTALPIDPGFEPALTALLSAGFAGVYYIGVRLLEKYVSPKFGWLLGLAKEPTYTSDKGE